MIDATGWHGFYWPCVLWQEAKTMTKQSYQAYEYDMGQYTVIQGVPKFMPQAQSLQIQGMC